MKLAIIGYGKMGHMIEQAALRRGHQITSIIDVNNRDDFQSDAFKNADAAIEFTSPAAAYDNCMQAFSHHVKVVSGSTGWFAEHADEMRHLCNEEGQTLFWSSNFSVGVALFGAVNKYLARLMNGFPQYDVRIEEVHHIHKLDAPSGTAITLAEAVTANLDRKSKWVKGTLTFSDNKEKSLDVNEKTLDIKKETSKDNEETSDKKEMTSSLAALKPDELRIDSIRRGEVPGIHSVIYDSEADSIVITHDAHSRAGFALGAVLAAEYAATHNGLLSMDDMFHF